MELVGSSAQIQTLRKDLAALAPYKCHVLINGPTGAGKEVAARMLHRLSPRRDGPFVQCDLNTLADGVIESELFGHTRGAFTGAVVDRRGYFEEAHGGTLFLDEVGDASPHTQRKLLQVLQNGIVKRVGEQRERRLDVRVVMATNADLRALVTARKFREDLYYRITEIEVRLPALAEHPDDIPELAFHYLGVKAREFGVVPPALTCAIISRLVAYDWPGNVRELIGAITNLIVRGRLPARVRRVGRDAREWAGELLAALKRNKGKVADAARELRVSRQAVYRRMKREQIAG